LRKQHKQLQQKQQAWLEALRNKLAAEYGLQPNYLGQWIVPLGSVQEQNLAQDSRLSLACKTPFEAVYELRATEELQAWAEQLTELDEKIADYEQQLLSRLTQEFVPYHTVLQGWVQQVARLDLLWAKLRLAQSYEGCCPELSSTFSFTRGRHPLLCQGKMQPIDFSMQPGVAVLIGPNMGGKTVALKTIGLIAGLALYGCYVPAWRCQLPLFSWLATVMGDQQAPMQGLSSFGGELVRLKRWLQREDLGLLLLDELGRGTNPQEGAALAYGLTCYLAQRQVFAVHVTHFAEVLRVPKLQGYQIAGVRLTAELKQLTTEELLEYLRQNMDYSLRPLDQHSGIPKQALSLAALLGLDEQILQAASELANI
jgi:DNA mismatch repair ATPase MutS